MISLLLFKAGVSGLLRTHSLLEVVIVQCLPMYPCPTGAEVGGGGRSICGRQREGERGGGVRHSGRLPDQMRGHGTALVLGVVCEYATHNYMYTSCAAFSTYICLSVCLSEQSASSVCRLQLTAGGVTRDKQACVVRVLLLWAVLLVLNWVCSNRVAVPHSPTWGFLPV